MPVSYTHLHVLGVIDERRYDEEMRKFDQLVRDITKAVILPKPMELSLIHILWRMM